LSGSGSTSGSGVSGSGGTNGNGTASNGASPNTASGTNGSSAVTGASDSSSSGAAPVGDTSGQIIVSLVRPATLQLPGAVSVLVPEAIVSGGSGFSFPLPKALVEATGSGKLQVSLKNGKRLPSWLRYASGTKTFIATAVPANALPIGVVLRMGGQSWSMVVTEKSSR
jgi:hypothetical protein